MDSPAFTTSALSVRESKTPDGAHDHIADVYVPHRLVPMRGADFDFKMTYFETPRLTFGHVKYGADAELFCPPMDSCYHLNVTLRGTTSVTQLGRSAVTEGRKVGAVFNPEDEYRVRWSPEGIQYALKLPVAAVREQLAALLGEPVDFPRFELSYDLSTAAGLRLVSAVQHLRQQFLSSDGGGLPPALIAQLESYVLTQALLATQHSYSHQLAQQPLKAAPRGHVKAAQLLLQERAEEAWTVESLAREVSISARALQMGFRADVGMSPMEFLREMRLRRARELLIAAGPGARVSEIATRCGFFHLARFSAAYRDRFGMLPSDALKGSWSS